MGDELIVNIERVQAFGTVVWSDSGECGIVFEPPLHAEDELYLRELVAAAREELDWEVSDVTLSRACRALQRTRKKRRVRRPSSNAKMSPKRVGSGRQNN